MSWMTLEQKTDDATNFVNALSNILIWHGKAFSAYNIGQLLYNDETSIVQTTQSGKETPR